MNIPSDTELLEQVEAFLNRTGMPPTRFGIEATGESGLVKSIRDGRSITLRTGRRLVDFMNGYKGATAASSGNSGVNSRPAEQESAA